VRLLRRSGAGSPRKRAGLYQAYHMEAADVFYNREDLWQFPRLPGGGAAARMAPYYIIMRLPGEPQANSSNFETTSSNSRGMV
jgi:uncharacterized membrane protein (UPF0182 family)